MKIGIEMHVDLLAAHLAQQAKLGLVAAVHESLRVLPLLETATSVAYVNLRDVKYTDFRPVAGGFATPKERYGAQERTEEARDVLARAGLVVMRVASDAATAARLPVDGPGRAMWIVYGDRRAGGWARASQLLRASSVVLIEFGDSRLLVSSEAVEALGGKKAWLPEAAMRHAEALARVHPQRLVIEQAGGPVRLRYVAEPVRWAAAGTEWLAHTLMQENRALFNTRGLGSLIVPWPDKCTLMLLLRNVRDRVDDLVIAVENQVLRPQRVDYTEHGAVLAVNQPEIPAARDALLHLELPRRAVPNDGFCDIGALSASLEMGA